MRTLWERERLFQYLPSLPKCSVITHGEEKSSDREEDKVWALAQALNELEGEKEKKKHRKCRNNKKRNEKEEKTKKE